MLDFLLIDGILLFLATLAALAVVRMRSLFAATMMLSIYSLLMALVWLNLDAVDVAFTEAAVGAGISTILLIGALVLVGSREASHRGIHWPALVIVVLTAAALIYGTLDMPALGDPQAPVHTHPIAPGYIRQDVKKTDSPGGEAGNYFHGHVPNMVTAVIVTYRAYDTMFEIAVIFTAGMGMILLLRGRRDNLPEEGRA